MNKLIYTLILIFFVSNTFSQRTYLSFNKNGSGIENTLPSRNVADNNTILEIEYNFPGAFAVEKNADGTDYTFLHIDGFGQMQQIGKPSLPCYNDLIAIPLNATVDITILETQTETFEGYNIHPALEPALDFKDAPEPEFIKDAETYSENAFFPKELVKTLDIQYLRGEPLGFIQIRPVQYNPVTRQLKVHSKIKYRIEFKGGNKNHDFDIKNSLDFQQNKNRLILNPKSATQPDRYDSGAKDYIIVTTDEFRQAADSLAVWKRQLGYYVDVVCQNSWTSAQVKEAIHSRYWAWNPKPDHFVIIGDHEDVPGEVKTGGHYGKWATDLYYACMDGAKDYLPDMSHGRISVTSTDEALQVIQKIINYERYPVSDAGFYKNAMHAAYFQHAGGGYAERRFAHTSEEVRDYMLGQNNDVNRVYVTESDVTPTNWNKGYFSDGQAIPNELLRSNGFAWNGNATDIISEINSGRFYVLHRDHGDITLWGDPYFTQSNIRSLNNGIKTPVVFSINCLTGDYYKPECFAETFLRHNNGGAVGVIAAAEVSLSGYNDGLAVGMFDAIWASPGIVPNFGSGGVNNPNVSIYNDIVKMGEVLNHGLLQMSQTWGGKDYVQYEHELFHYHGDPAMRIFTEKPQQISATCPSSIDFDATSVVISNCNVNDATTTIIADGQLLGKQILSNNITNVDLKDLPNNCSSILLTISARNKVPMIKIIKINNSPQNNCPIMPIWTYYKSIKNVKCLTINGDYIWIGTHENGAYKLKKSNGEVISSFNATNGLINNTVNCITIDKDNKVWFGTDDGISVLHETNCTTYTIDNGLSTNRIFSMEVDNDKNIWIGTWGGGITKYDGESFSYYTTANGLINNIVYSIKIDNQNNKWFGCSDGISILKDNTITSHGYSDNVYWFVREVVVDLEGDVWLGTQGNGLLKHNEGSFTRHKLYPRVDDKYILNVAIDSDGSKWFGTYDGVYKYNESEYSFFSTDNGLLNDEVADIIVDENDIWFCSSDGIAKLQFVSNSKPNILVSPIEATIINNFPIKITASGANTYSWQPSTGLSNTIGNVVTANPQVSTTYTVTGTNEDGCSSKVQSTICVIPQLSTIAITGDLNFGDVALGHSEVRTLTIRNTGQSTIKIIDIRLPCCFSCDWHSGEINMGKSQTVSITFTPDRIKDFSCELKVYSNAISGTDILSVSANGIPEPQPVLSLSGDIDFGNVQTNSTNSKNLTISNTGNAPLEINSIYCANGFTSNWHGGIIQAGSSKTINISFTPSIASEYSGNVIVYSNATSGSNTVSVSGTGIPEPQPILSLSGDLDFNKVQINTTSTKNLTISNTGNAPLEINSIYCANGFTSNWNGGTIQAGSSKTVSISFTPSMASGYSGNVIVYSNATNGSNTISVSGSGIPEPQPALFFSSDIDFGNIQINTTITKTLTVSNTGNAPLVINSISFPSGFSGDWNSATIQSNSSKILIVTFSPTLVSYYSGNIIVNSNASSGNNMVKLSGIGTNSNSIANWTFMLYLYEDGTGLDGADDFNEWEANGSIDGVINYIVLYDAEDDRNDGIWYVKKDANGYDSHIISDIVSTHLGKDPDMDDWRTLRDFIVWGQENYPAEHYGITVWDHGSGIFKDPNPVKGAVGDMKLWEMDKALQEFTTAAGQKADILGFDVCLLGQIETAYQMKDYVNYIIASEKTEPGDGWDYEAPFKKLNNNPTMDAEILASHIVNDYVASYNNGSQGNREITQTAVSTEALIANLIPSLNSLAEKLITYIGIYKSQIKTARNDSWYQHSNPFVANPQHRDIGHFAQIIKDDNSFPSDLRSSADTFLNSYKKAIIAEGHTGSSTIGASGLKIWMTENISNSGMDEIYYTDKLNYLIFSETKWDEYLYAYEENIKGNTPPTISNINIFSEKDQNIVFTPSDFSNSFTDEDRSDILQNIKIVTLPDNGILQFKGESVIVNQIVSIEELNELIFIPQPNWTGSTVFIYSAFDGFDFSTVNAVVMITVQNPNSIKSVNIIENLKIYPNPTDNKLFIEIPQNIDKFEYLNLRLINMNGKTIINKSLEQNIRTEINLSQYTKGTYLLILETEGTINTEKIIIE